MRPLALVAAALVAACGSHALAPGAPTAPPALTATAATDGVTLRLDLDRASIRPGEVLWATVTVTNTNDRAINWVSGGCDVAGHVMARLPALADYGHDWDYAFAELKKRLALAASPGYVPFLDEAGWAQRAQGARACTAIITSHDLAPRGTLVTRFAWDGTLSGGAAAPNGDVSIIASLDMNDRTSMTGRSVTAALSLPLSGGAATRVSPGQALDAALADQRVASWVRARLVARGNSEPGAYDASGGVRLDGDAWVITASQKAPPSGDLEVRVSALDGTVLSVVAR